MKSGTIVAITPEKIHRPGMEYTERNRVVVQIGRKDHVAHFGMTELPFRVGETVGVKIDASEWIPNSDGARAHIALRVQLPDCAVPTDYVGFVREVRPVAIRGSFPAEHI